VTYTYTRSEGRHLIESSGFHTTDIFVSHIFPYRISEYVNMNTSKRGRGAGLRTRCFAGWSVISAGIYA